MENATASPSNATASATRCRSPAASTTAASPRTGGSRRFRDAPVTWHYNQDPDEYAPADHDEVRRYGGAELHTWPAGSGYPDYFFFGDPHINFYEGTAEFDDLDLYVPDDRPP